MRRVSECAPLTHSSLRLTLRPTRLAERARDTIDALHRDLAAAHAATSSAVADASAAAAKRAHAEAVAAVTREQLVSMLTDLKARQQSSTQAEAALLTSDMARIAAEAALEEAQAQVAELTAQLQSRAAAAAASRQLSNVIVESAQKKQAAAHAQCHQLRAELAEVRTGATPGPRTAHRRPRDGLASPAVASVRAALAFGTPVHGTQSKTSSGKAEGGEAASGGNNEYEEFLEAQVAQLEMELADMAQLVEQSTAEAAHAKAALSPLAASSHAALADANTRADAAEERAVAAEAAAAAAASALGAVQDALDAKQMEVSDMSAQVMALAQRMRALSAGTASPGAGAWYAAAGSTATRPPRGGGPEPSALHTALAGLERELASARAAAATAVSAAREAEVKATSARQEAEALREEAETLAGELADAKHALAESQRVAAQAQRRADGAEAAAAEAKAKANSAMDQVDRVTRAREQERQAAAAAAAASAASEAHDEAAAAAARAEKTRLREQYERLIALLGPERAALEAALRGSAQVHRGDTPVRQGAGGEVVPSTPEAGSGLFSSRNTLTSEALDALEAALAKTPDQENGHVTALNQAALAGLPDGIEVVAGIGGGMAVDTAKYFAWRRGIRLVTIPTALTVDAFVTPPAGVRQGEDHTVSYQGAAAPDPLVIDFDLIRTAPAWLNVAGVGDILSCHTACWDWELAHKKGRSADCPFSPADVAAARGVLATTLAAARDIAGATDAGLRALVHGYMQINALCLPAGHPRCEEGSEHFLLYVLESRLKRGFIHGHIVGLGIYLMARLQGNDAERITHAMRDMGLRFDPESMGLSRAALRGALLALKDFKAGRPELFYTVIDEAVIDEAWVESALHGLAFSPE